MSLPLKERLKSRTDIQRLMSEGDRLKAYPLKLVYRDTTEDEKESTQLAVSVPKRLHSHAVDRNLLKRRIKESYRQSTKNFKQELEKEGKSMDIMLIYMSAEKLEMQELSPKIILLFQRLQAITLNPSSLR